jgi:linoleoyl-CoA desaturase
VAATHPSPVELRDAHRRLHGKALLIGAIVGLSYWSLVFRSSSVVGYVVAAVALTVGLIATATSVFHDGNHASFSTSRTVNRLAGYTGDLLGASSWIWRFKHNNLHHGNTNVDGVDTDIDQAPFARLSPQQTWRPWHRYQHLYMWVLYGFLTLQWFLISDFVNLTTHGVGDHRFPRQPRRRTLVGITAGKALHFGWAFAVPFLFHAWWVVLTFYVAVSWTVGLALAVMFQLAHCTQVSDFPGRDAPRRGTDFVQHQLDTTADVRCRTRLGPRGLHWIMGGLDFQVEHHLAPRLPHTIYPLVAARVRQACIAEHLRLRSHSTPWQAIRSHGRWLKLMGARPSRGMSPLGT